MKTKSRKYPKDPPKNECFLCHRRKYLVYEQLSGIHICARADCNEVRVDNLNKYFRSQKGKVGRLFKEIFEND